MTLHHGLRATSFGAGDPHFRNTVLLLRGDGTNGAQNNTFLDGSTNNFTITRNGNTTQGSSTPYWPDGRWSNYFDGTGDYLSLTGQNLSSGTWTIECWVNFSSFTNTSPTIFNFGTDVNNRYGVYRSTNGKFSLYTVNAGSYNITDGTTVPVVGAWYHVAAVNSGGSTKLYINGSLEATNSGAINSGTSWAIGFAQFSAATANYMTGNISNFRVVNGSAVYTSAFTPSALPLTAVTNTSLLTCQSNRFIDNSSNAFTLTRNGDAAVSAFNPFPPVEEYSASSYGGSGYFDGTGDYLSHSGTTLNGDFCCECWFYKSSNPTNYSVIFGGSSSGADANNTQLYVGNTGSVGMALSGSAIISATGTAAVTAQWNHLAWVRNGSNVAIFVNGARQATGTSSVNTSVCSRIGAIGSLTGYLPIGYISNARIVVGSSVYDPTATTLTVPTTPTTAITNTQLLLNFTNGGIVDLTRNNNLETVGNAQISTSTKKYGTGSVSFDGTDDWLQFPHMPFYNLTGDFTIECWVYLNTTTGAQNLFYKSDNNATGVTFLLNNGVTGRVSLLASNTGTTWPLQLNSTTNIAAGAWYHLAGTRSGSTWTIWINGVSSGSTTNTLTPLSTTTPLRIGIFRTAEKQPLNGYLDDYRVTAGVCRYSSNFVPPTRQLSAR